MFSWQWYLVSAVCLAAFAGVMGYYMDRDELICIRLEK